ncbi:FAD-dependent monooxygenase [Pseudonocardia sp. C8]|uniref:FAD-dependent monooxygenase n=1 Tax=Pseudonocardia sp. C8 TaxID=2762759 RepID=UPI0016431EFD|nr:FAD-dependent monooxygenase [Pseudonocardia sp. C8]MBC3192287.1 FAD-dependent monooxygenase [Pseudonocardia sp. C8]
MKVVICGAGIAGLALAHRLGTLGCEVVVLERAPGPRPQGYMIDFFGPGYDAAEAMGVLPRLRELGYRFEEATFVDGTGRRRAGLKFDVFGRVMQGRLFSILRPDLERGLREQLPDGVDLRFGTGVTAVHRTAGGVRVTLGDGGTLDADLLVGADGIHSTVRRLVFGAEHRFLRHLGFHTTAFLFEDARIHRELGGRLCLTDTVDRQMGLYALRDGRIATFGVHRAPGPTLPDDAATAVRREYGSLPWIVPQVLDRCPPSSEVYYDQVAQVELPRWSDGRVVLLGDAAYAVSLLAGQGASLAVAGAYVLAQQLAGAGSIEAALEGYERLWRPVAEEKQRVARAGVQWFLPHSRIRLLARRVLIGLSRVPGLDRYVARGLAGDALCTREWMAGPGPAQPLTGATARPGGPASSPDARGRTAGTAGTRAPTRARPTSRR